MIYNILLQVNICSLKIKQLHLSHMAEASIPSVFSFLYISNATGNNKKDQNLFTLLFCINFFTKDWKFRKSKYRKHLNLKLIL